jgi:hypothetical protein
MMHPSLLAATLLCLSVGYTARAQTGQPPVIQQAISAGGGASSALTGYTVDFTIGETVFLTAGTDPACTEGLQQPMPATIAKTDSNLLTATWYIKVHPNPVRDQLTVHAYMDKAGQVSLRLVDFMGRVVLSRQVSFQQGYNDVLLNTAALGHGIYVLYILDEAHGSNRAVKLLKE